MNKIRILLIQLIAICLLFSCSTVNISPDSSQESNDIAISPRKSSQTDTTNHPPFSIRFIQMKTTSDNGWTEYIGSYSFVFNNSPFIGEIFPIVCIPDLQEENADAPLEDLNQSHVTTDEGYSYPAYLDKYIIPWTWPTLDVLLAPGLPVRGEWLMPSVYNDGNNRSHPIITNHPERAWANGAGGLSLLYLYEARFKIPETMHPKTLVIPCLDMEIEIPDSGFIDTRIELLGGISNPPGTYQRDDLNLSLHVGSFEYSTSSISGISSVMVPIEIINNDLTSSFSNLDERLYVTLIDNGWIMWKPDSRCSEFHLENRAIPNEVGPGQKELARYCFVSLYEELLDQIPISLYAIIGDESDTKIYMDRDLSD